MNYTEFLESKRHSIGNFGFEANFIPDCAFDFQEHVIRKAIKKGRVAVFLDTGLGKTLVQLSIAKNIVNHTNKKVLMLTPLAVGFQFIKEAKDRNITDDIELSKDGKHTKKIVVCNYERLHYFDPKDFECVILDESSILKNYDGKIKNMITAFIKKIPYRFLSTATPSPNDFIELGTSSEALGYMGYMDMLTKFFKNNQNSVDSTNRNIGEKFYLKPHAEKDFFAWVNQWSIMAKMPSDLGFSNDRYVLPELNINKHVVKNQSLIDVDGQIQMFTPIAKSMTEVRHEQKQTEEKRCEKAIELASGKTSVYWCNTNNESKLLKELDYEAVEIIGSQSIDKKEEILLAFANGEIQRLITKAKMTSMGLNWQHCNHSVFFPTWSYEQYYQAIRRFWRFGQTKDVTIDMVISDGQTRVLEALEQKTQKAIDLHRKLTENVNRSFINKTKEFNQELIKPTFIIIMENKVKDQIVTDQYAIYNSDCMLVMPTLETESIDLSVYSPPFAGLYNYSSSEHDMSNCESKEQFLQQYEYLIKEISRVTKPGRISAVHVTDVFDNTCRLWDFPHEVIKLHEKYGFEYRNRITIWKEPLKVRMRTMVQSLMHKFIVEDSTRCFTAMPDYVLVFTKKGENEVPVTHPYGINHYAGEIPILPNILRAWNNANNANLNEDELWEYLNNHNEDEKVTKLNHYIWQRYASSVWDDIRIDNVLPFRDSREDDDEKHVHPLQLDVIDRLVELYSNPGEVILTPFMGVGSEVFSPVSMGRKAIGIELKDSYFKQAKLNLKEAEKRFRETVKQESLF